MKRKLYTFLVCLFAAIACHKVEDTAVTNEKHVCRLNLELSVETYELSTKGSGENLVWENGTKLFLNFSNNEDPITGVAEYNAVDDSWALSYTGNLNLAEKQLVSVYYFTDYEYYESIGEITLGPTSAIYSDTDGTYSFLEDGELRVLAHLTPAVGRIRFKGDVGADIEIDGIVYNNSFDLFSEEFTFSQSSIVANVKSDGFTSYIYGRFADATNLLKITQGEFSYIRDCSEGVLEKGKSGWMKIPSNQSHEGWTFFDIPSLQELSSTSHNLSLEITSANQWEIEVVGTSPWIVVQEMQGIGDKTICIEIMDNASMNERSDIIRVSSELGLITDFKIVQRGRIFEIDVQELIFDYNNQQSELLSVNTDGPFNIICDADWISFVDITSNSFKLQLMQNDSKLERETVIVVSLILDNGESASKEIFITQAEYGHGYYGPYKYVDLGLSSGRKWSTYNIGSNDISELGSPFAWGETYTKSSFSWDNYRYGWRTEYSDYISMGVTKYNYKGQTLEDEDDAAYINYGKDWHTPSRTEWAELYNSCTWSTITLDNQKILEGIGPNGACIYLPFSQRAGTICIYWTNEVHYTYRYGADDHYYNAKCASITYIMGKGSISIEDSSGSDANVSRPSAGYVRPVLR